MEQDQTRKLRLGEWTDPKRGRVALSAVAADWLESRSSAKRRTREADEADWRLHIAPRFGSFPLVSITAAEVSSWVGAQIAAGRRPSSVTRYLATLRSILNYAIAFGNLTPPTSIDHGCSCGNDAEPGTDPVCAHTSHCYCAACVHADHVRPATCAVTDCGLSTRLQITPWSVQSDSRAWKPATDPLTDDDQLVPGDRRKPHRPMFACGMIHARLLVGDDQRLHPVAGQPDGASLRNKTPLGRLRDRRLAVRAGPRRCAGSDQPGAGSP
jgi:hypothetical protein